jgi:hypothetical protein
VVAKTVPAATAKSGSPGRPNGTCESNGEGRCAHREEPLFDRWRRYFESWRKDHTNAVSITKTNANARQELCRLASAIPGICRNPTASDRKMSRA